jgi:hypothetical protein
MRREMIVIVVVVVAELGYTAHTLDLLGIIKKLHGG